MGLQHYTQDMSRIPLKYHTNVLFYTKYTHPTLICRGTHARTDARTENIYSIFRDKLLLLGEHGFFGSIFVSFNVFISFSTRTNATSPNIKPITASPSIYA